MTLPDYPSSAAVKWDPGPPPEMLTALGNLAVISAHVEELLHQIYWHHAGLNEKSGPIVTDNLNPKRLQEDILKLVTLDSAKTNIKADLKILFDEFQDLNTKRNHCLHWIWQETPPSPESSAIPHKVRRPIYRQSGATEQEFSVEDVRRYCNDFHWLAFRLRCHTFPDDELREKRGLKILQGTIEGGLALRDLFWPAPWLDRPPPQVSKRSDRQPAQK